MSTDTQLRECLSNLLVAYAACNGEDHPAYLEAEAALNGKKTRDGVNGPSFIRDEARGSGGTGDDPLLTPKPAVPSFVPDPAPDSHTVGPDLRLLAVEIVDCVRGYTYEFSGHPSAHAADYDLVEEKLRAALASRAEQ